MVKISVAYENEFRVSALHESGAKLITDAPKDRGGQGKNFSPTDLIAVALGTCILTVMGMAAKMLGIDFQGAQLTISKEMKTEPQRMIGQLDVHFFFPRQLEDVHQKQLEKAAMACPVHASLHPDVQQKFTFHWGDA